MVTPGLCWVGEESPRGLRGLRQLAPRRTWAAGAALAVVLDALLGEPPSRVHPVGWFGKTMQGLERAIWRDSRGRGVAYLLIGVALATTAAWCAVWLCARAVEGVGRTRVAGRVLGASLVAWVAIAARALRVEARAVADAVERGALDEARRRIRSLVGRDPEALDAHGLLVATFESVAENTVDAVAAPLLWATVAGPVAAALYRAVNTLDAMVGYRSERYRCFGWAAARADDVLGYLPARATVLGAALLRPRRAAAVLAAARAARRARPSPNAGVAEGAFAAAVGVRLDGPVSYGGVRSERPTIGTGLRPTASDVEAACRLSCALGWAFAVAAALWALRPVRWAAGRGRRGTGAKVLEAPRMARSRRAGRAGAEW